MDSGDIELAAKAFPDTSALLTGVAERVVALEHGAQPLVVVKQGMNYADVAIREFATGVAPIPPAEKMLEFQQRLDQLMFSVAPTLSGVAPR